MTTDKELQEAVDTVHRVQERILGPQKVWVLVTETGGNASVSVHADADSAAFQLHAALDEHDEFFREEALKELKQTMPEPGAITIDVEDGLYSYTIYELEVQRREAKSSPLKDA